MWIISDPEPMSEMGRRRTRKVMSREFGATWTAALHSILYV